MVVSVKCRKFLSVETKFTIFIRSNRIRRHPIECVNYKESIHIISWCAYSQYSVRNWTCCYGTSLYDHDIITQKKPGTYLMGCAASSHGCSHSSALMVQIMACRLVGAKPLPEPSMAWKTQRSASLRRCIVYISFCHIALCLVHKQRILSIMKQLILCCGLGPLLLTWFNVNFSMDKQSYSL